MSEIEFTVTSSSKAICPNNFMKTKLTDPMQRHYSIVALILCATLLTAPGISRADTIYVSNLGYSVIARVDSGTGASLGFLQGALV